MIYKTTGKMFNAVLACQAVDDVRPYLNGFFISHDRAEMVATTGHILMTCHLQTMSDNTPKEQIPDHKRAGHGWLFERIEKPLLKAVQEVWIDTQKQTLTLIGGRYKGPVEIPLKLMDKKYVDYPRVLVKNDTAAKVPALFAFDPELIARCFRWANAQQSERGTYFVIPKSHVLPIEVKFMSPDFSNLHAYIMQIRESRNGKGK